MKKIIMALLAVTMVLAMAACGAGKTVASGGIVTAELPGGWSIVSGEESIGDASFDFIKAPDGTSNFSILRDSQDIEHYKEMIATGNYGKDLGTVELGEGTWCMSEKVAAGPIGEYTCVIQTYGCDLTNPEVQAILASLKWVEK